MLRDEIKEKCVLVGDVGVGKTSLMIVYGSEDHKFPEEYCPTVLDNLELTVNVNGRDMILSLWDTHGDEDYDELRPLSYTGTSVFLVCFALNDLESLENVKTKWVPEIKKHCFGAKSILVGLKSDLQEKYEKEKNEEQKEEKKKKKFFLFRNSQGGKFDMSKLAKQMSKKLKMVGYISCSSKIGEGVKEVFNKVIDSHFCAVR